MALSRETHDAASSSAVIEHVQAAALRTIRRHADLLGNMAHGALAMNEAREIVRIDIAAMEQITDPVLRRQALLGLQRCARSQPSYLAEMREQI